MDVVIILFGSEKSELDVLFVVVGLDYFTERGSWIKRRSQKEMDSACVALNVCHAMLAWICC